MSCAEVVDHSVDRSFETPLRVLIVDCAVSVGGTPIVAAHIATLLQAHGHEALIVTALDKDDAESVFPPSVATVLLRHTVTYDDARELKTIFRDPKQPWQKRAVAYLRNQFAGLLNLRFAFELAKLIKNFDAHIVHVNNGYEPHMAAALTARPSVQQVHGLYSPHTRLIDRLLLRLPKHFISISDVVAQSVRACGIDGTRITVVPNFLAPRRQLPDKSAARRQLGLEEHPIVAIVGRVVPWKGQAEFIRSMRHVADRVPNVQIVIAGDCSDGEAAYFSSVRELTEALGLSGRTHFVGHLQDPYVAYRAADVVAHCSLEPEPFGMVLIEAMEAGTPVVAAASGGPLEIVEDGVSGFLVDPTSPEAFAQPVINLLLRPELAEQVAQAARRRFLDTYSAEAVYPQLMRLYSRFVRAEADAKSV